jgi:hypothetical protein
MEMARDRYRRFPGNFRASVAKRTGPLVAVALNAASPDDAEKPALAGKIRGIHHHSRACPLPNHKDNTGQLYYWNIMILLVLVLAGFMRTFRT